MISQVDEEGVPGGTGARRNRSRAAAWGGPLLIVGSVLVVLNAFVLHNRLTTADVRTFWLPTYCFMGKSLAHGHIPLWNPYTLSGSPFAADPQSGWMYLPPMLLFSILPCDVAIRSMIVLQPLLAGLGLHWFLRSEGMSRPSATSGGLVLGLATAGSMLVLSLPFAGTLAWTAILLACASRYLRAGSWPARLVWCLLTAAAWGQLAAAHLSVGLLMGTGALAFFMVGKVWDVVGRGGPPRRELVSLVALLVGAMLVINLAYLLPRLAFVPRTSLSLGYGSLQQLAQRLARRPILAPRVGRASGILWPLKLATSPGAHLGAIALGLAFAGWWRSRHRHLAIAFTVYMMVGYVLTLRAVARRVPESLRQVRVADFYLHAPEWFGYMAILCLAVLAALGIQAWLEARPKERGLMAIPGVLVWGVLPPLLGASPARLALLWVGGAVGIGALFAAVRRPQLTILIPAVLAAELVGNGLLPRSPSPFQPSPLLLENLSDPSVQLRQFLSANAIASRLQTAAEGRFAAPGKTRPPRGPEGSGLGLLNKSLLFHIKSAEGYSPVQLLRYWEFVRGSQRAFVPYNRAFFRDIPPLALDLLDVRYIQGATSRPPLPGLSPLVAEGETTLYEVQTSPPPASLFRSWRVVAGPESALSGVLSPQFEPAGEIIVEGEPALAGGPAPGPDSESRPGTSDYRTLGPEQARILVEASGPSILLIRTPYDPGWQATVDGKPVRVHPADYVAQGIPVPSGRHTVDLVYRDPWVGPGLAGSGLGVALLLGTAGVLWRRDRVRPRPAGTPS
jgi:membrane protein YfhO